MLDRPRVLAVVGEFVASGVAEHVGMDGKPSPATVPALATSLRMHESDNSPLDSPASLGMAGPKSVSSNDGFLRRHVAELELSVLLLF
jgi:hypothetical protein